MNSKSSWRGFPLAFFGYGFQYAWGYVSWSTASLATQSVSGGEFDLSWLVSATLVPIVLVLLAALSRRHDVEHMRSLYVAAPVIAVIGTLLSVVYQAFSDEPIGYVLAVASGVGTGAGSALFGLLWSLDLSRLSMERLEVIVPTSFLVSAFCALVVPGLGQFQAMAVAMTLVVLSCFCLVYSHEWVERWAAHPDGLETSWFEEAGTARAEDVPSIVRMLVFGVLAWTVMNAAPTVAGTGVAGPLFAGIDVAGVLGYILSMAFALLIIRYAVRVDFQALSLMTLPVLVLSMTLYAVGTEGAQFWAGVLNVALNSCCEIILLLYFIRIAQGRPGLRAFWLALGSAASYLGVLLGQLADGWFARWGVIDTNPALFCLVIVCVYVFAMLLIPQRSYDVPARAGRVGLTASSPSAAERPAAVPAGLAASAPRPESSAPAAPPALDVSPAIDAPSGTSVSPDAISLACARAAERFQLSAREAEVCEYLARGRSQAYIRDALYLSKNSVATYVRRLYTKLDVHSKQELIDLVEGLR